MLVIGLTANAQGATGQFRHTPENGEDFAVGDPADGECHLLIDGALRADNGTDTPATFYQGDCESAVVGEPLQPGTARSFEAGTVPRSVTFG